MWVLNIYPNTGSNIVGAENKSYWLPLKPKWVRGERGERRKVPRGRRYRERGVMTEEETKKVRQSLDPRFRC